MKKLFLTFISLCLMISVWAFPAPTTLTVSSTAGGLSSAIKTAGGSLTTVTTLTVSGTIDARDFKMMRDSMTLLAGVDLGAVNIDAYTGTEGTSNSLTIYNANSIPFGGFYNKPQLISVILPTTITNIAGYAFSTCEGLNSIIIPTGVNTIGDAAFASCSNLTSIVIPSSVTSMGYNVFLADTKLTSAILSSSLTIINNGTFNGCTGLTSITIPSSVTTIGNDAFERCTGLTSITIPSSVTTIGHGAFQECSGLTSVSVPSSVTSIGYSAFIYCTNLTSATIPTTTTYISDYLFYGCTNLLSFNISSQVHYIGSHTFHGCQSISSITIPSSVNGINNDAFHGCIGLTSIFVNKTIPIDLSSCPFVFSNVDTINCILHVPFGSKSLYQLANQWKAFQNIVEDLPTSTFNATASNLKINTNNGKAEISGLPQGASVAVYNLQGTAIYNQKATAETISVNLPARGIYIVKVGSQSLKVIN